MRKSFPIAALTILGLGLAVTCGQAQIFGIGGGESERVLRPNGYHAPYDGMSFSQRYNWEMGSAFYLGLDARSLYWADYFDRLERAHKFGYRPPCEPCFPNAKPARTGWRCR